MKYKTLEEIQKQNDQCRHNFRFKAELKEGEEYEDIYYCIHCLKYIRKVRPCPLEIEKV